MKLLPNPTGDNFLDPFAVTERRILADRIQNCEVVPTDIFDQKQYRKFLKLIREERKV